MWRWSVALVLALGCGSGDEHALEAATVSDVCSWFMECGGAGFADQQECEENLLNSAIFEGTECADEGSYLECMAGCGAEACGGPLEDCEADCFATACPGGE